MTIPNTNQKQARQEFLDVFYASVNCEKGSDTWHDYFLQNGFPALLPYKQRGNPNQPWKSSVLFLSENGSDFRVLQEQCRAFLGRAYLNDLLERSTGTARNLQKLGLDDPWYGIVRLKNGADENAFERTLQTWFLVWQERAQNYAETPPTEVAATQLRKLQRKFEQSLTVGNRTGAQAVLRTLEERALLDRNNILFLQIRLHAFFEDWQAIAENESFTELMHIRRTDPVTEALLQSVYHTRLAPVANDTGKMFARFADVYSDYQPLFRARGNLRSSEVLKLFMLRHVALSGDRDWESARALVALPDLPQKDANYLHTLMDYAAQSQAATTPSKQDVTTQVPTDELPPSVPTANLALVRHAFQRGEDDKAFSLFRTITPGSDKVRTIFEFTRDTGSLVAQSIALETLHELPPVERKKILRSPSLQREIKRFGVALRSAEKTEPTDLLNQATLAVEISGGLSAETVSTTIPVSETLPFSRDSTIKESITDLPATLPVNWTQWLEAVEQDTFDNTALYDLAVAGTEQWRVEEVASPALARTFAARIDELRDKGQAHQRALFFDALPCLIRAVANETDFPRAEAAPIYNSLRATISYDWVDIRFDRDVLSLYYDMLLASLQTGHKSEYSSLLDEIESFWGKDAPAYARFLLDFLDALQDFPTSDAPNRQALATRAFATVARWKQNNRLATDAAVYARRLAHEYGLEDMILPSLPVAEEDATSVETTTKANWTQLEQKKVGIYTLMESAGNRLKRLINERCAGCSVEINSEKDGSERLYNLAKTANVFVIVTGCAKHAATDFIEQARSPGMPILRPDGRGSSSVLSALENYLHQSGNVG